MRAVMEYDRKMIAGYTGKIDQLKGLKELQERDAKRKEKIRTSISLKKQEVEADQREKAAFLNQVRKDKKSYQTSLRDLEANARRLQVMVEKLEAISRKSYSDKLEK